MEVSEITLQEIISQKYYVSSSFYLLKNLIFSIGKMGDEAVDQRMSLKYQESRITHLCYTKSIIHHRFGLIPTKVYF